MAYLLYVKRVVKIKHMVGNAVMISLSLHLKISYTATRCMCDSMHISVSYRLFDEFVGSLLCTERFSPGTPVSPLLKNQNLT